MSKDQRQTKHTPGPWVHDPKRCVIFAPTVQREYDDEGGCVVVDLTASMSGDNPNADANLMAAAPDMLAELESVSRDLGDLMRHCNKEGNREQARMAHDSVMTVIRKARGDA